MALAMGMAFDDGDIKAGAAPRSSWRQADRRLREDGNIRDGG